MKLSLAENYETPEPQYTETKSSILRRRNSIAKLNSSGKLSESLEQPGRRRRSKRRFSSLTNLTDLTPTGKKASGGRRRRNSISLDDIQNLKRSFRGSEDGRSGSNFPPSTFGTSKKFSQYTGTSPKEKIEFADYTSVRDVSPPRRFSRQSRPRKRETRYGPEEDDGGGGDLPSLEFTYDINGDIVSTSSLDKSTSRREKRSDQLPTPRYMDWYTKQQQQQKELLLLRQAALQEQQEQHKARMQEKHRMRLERGEQQEEEEEEERSGEEVVPGDSVSNQGEGAVEEGTDDAKLKRLSTAERKENEMFAVAGIASATKTRPSTAEVLLLARDTQ